MPKDVVIHLGRHNRRSQFADRKTKLFAITQTKAEFKDIPEKFVGRGARCCRKCPRCRRCGITRGCRRKTFAIDTHFLSLWFVHHEVQSRVRATSWRCCRGCSDGIRMRSESTGQGFLACLYELQEML